MKYLNQNVIEIINLLSDGQYYDDISINESLNISRAAVCKAIKKLEQYGVPLVAVKGKGYCLEKPFILLNADKIKANLKHQDIHLDVFETINSTNDYLKEIATQHKHIQVCIAEMQTKGRGRLGRKWHSPFGENIYFSMSYPFAEDVSKLSGLSLVVGLAVCSALESVTQFTGVCKLKWPNDVLVNQAKLAGVLIEMQAQAHGFCKVIIGIGMNVNMLTMTEQNINQSWSSLLKLTGQYQDRNLLSLALINTLVSYLQRFSTDGLSSFSCEWQKRDYLVNQKLCLLVGREQHQGICLGIDEQGYLLLQQGKELRRYGAGDATLLK